MLNTVPLVIFAGGKGTRLGSTAAKPKPMTLINNDPIIWEVISLYQKAGVRDFFICLGFGAQAIKNFFVQKIYQDQSEASLPKSHSPGADLTLESNGCRYHLLETGVNAETGARLAHAIPQLPETFFLTYADGLSDVNVADIYHYHQQKQNGLTLLAVQAAFQYGVVLCNDEQQVTAFVEKPLAPFWINAGFFVINKKVVIPFLEKGCNLSFEKDILPKVVTTSTVGAYKYQGFWGAVDTQKDLQTMREKWNRLTLL